MPGQLPVMNRKAVEYTIMTGLALGSEIPEATKWDRKNYPYPDLVKGYQISQYDLPLVVGGALEINVEGQTKQIRFERVHLEEDTGKLSHAGDGSTIDFNRAGMALMEMVSRPDIRTAPEARAFLIKLRSILRAIGVSTADMEKGQLRCDVNVSLRKVGTEPFGTKVEVKNLNSFRAAYNALNYEVDRQAELLDRGERVEQETRGWVEERGVTVKQRSKEQAHDYRYFPEPDLPPLFVDRAWVAELQAKLPELPDARRDRYVASYALSVYDAEQLSAEATTAAYFEQALAAGADPKKAANWIINDLFRLQGESGEEGHIGATALAELIKLVDAGTISSSAARQVFEAAFKSGKAPKALVDELGLAQVSDTGALEQAVLDVIAANPNPVADFKAGKDTAINFLKGAVMKATKGKANPAVAEQMLREKLA
jgi:aspartyl-tRNA(Asn)/glutamyl-tRNA(Gln) amidotransferase subunit B